MFIYNVTVNINDSVHDEWLLWMKEVHIPEVMETGFFTEHCILRLIGEEKSEGTSYAIQYFFSEMDDYLLYRDQHAPALQAKLKERYPDQFVAFRTILEVIK